MKPQNKSRIFSFQSDNSAKPFLQRHKSEDKVDVRVQEARL